MTKIADFAIAGERDEERDRALLRRMQVLSFIQVLMSSLCVKLHLRVLFLFVIASPNTSKSILP